jgi:hypothetical protein
MGQSVPSPGPRDSLSHYYRCWTLARGEGLAVRIRAEMREEHAGTSLDESERTPEKIGGNEKGTTSAFLAQTDAALLASVRGRLGIAASSRWV